MVRAVHPAIVPLARVRADWWVVPGAASSSDACSRAEQDLAPGRAKGNTPGHADVKSMCGLKVSNELIGRCQLAQAKGDHQNPEAREMDSRHSRLLPE